MPKKRISEGESALHGYADTYTFGSYPKITGLLGSLYARARRPDLFEDEGFGQTYKEGRDLVRERQKEASEQNPGAYFLGGLGGAVINPINKFMPTTNTKMGAALQGAGLGALYGLGSSDSGEVGAINPSNILSAGSHALLGGAVGGGIQGLINSNYIKQAAPKLNDLQQSILMLAKKHNIPLSLGQASQDIPTLLREHMLGMGAGTPESAITMNNLKNMQNSRFQERIGEVLNDLSNGHTFAEKGAGVAPAVNKIQQNAARDKSIVNAVYNDAKASIGDLDINKVNEFPNIAVDFLQKNAQLVPTTAPKAYSQITAFQQLFGKAPANAKSVSFQGLEGWRQGLNKALRDVAQGGQDELGLKILAKQFDEFIDNSIEKALVNGDAVVLDKFKNARGLAKEWFDKYQAKNSKEFGKKFVEDILENNLYSREAYTNEMLVNKIFGANKLGFKPEAVNIINEIKKQVGEHTSEFDGLKLEAAQRMLKPLMDNRGNITARKGDIETYKKAITENESILKMLFGKKYKEFVNLGDMGSVLYQAPKNAHTALNPPGSGVINALSKVPYVRGLIEKIADISERNQAKTFVDQRKLAENVLKLNRQAVEIPSTNNSFQATNSLMPKLGPDLNESQVEENIQPQPDLDQLTEDQLQRLLKIKRARKQ